MTEKYLIHSIYRASEGEGIFIGTPQIFIRYQGCAIGCVNCDSMDTWNFNDKYQTSLEEILNEVELISKDEKDLKRVSITGGDPLHPMFSAGLLRLVRELKKRGYFINIEASGTRIDPNVFALIDWISFDYKTPSAQVVTSIHLLKKLVKEYKGKYQIKSVVSNEEDFLYVLTAYQEVSKNHSGERLEWCLTPEYNLYESGVENKFTSILFLNENQGGPFRVIGQQHKWVFGANQKQV